MFYVMINTIYAVEGFGEARLRLPEISIMLLVLAGKAGKYQEHKEDSWRAFALQTSPQDADCVSLVINKTNIDLPAIHCGWYNAPHIEQNRVPRRINLRVACELPTTLDENYV